MFKSLKNNNSGFSIVEIMIVLIVVGLVTTGVLLAAQTLQRNARNDARDRDVQLISSGLQDYAQANGGSLSGANAAIEQSGNQFLDALNLTHYDKNNTNTDFDNTAGPTVATESQFIIRSGTTAQGTPNNNQIGADDILPNTDNIHIWVGYQCPDNLADLTHVNNATDRYGKNNSTASFPDVTTRAFIIVYQHEGGGSPYRCVDFGS